MTLNDIIKKNPEWGDLEVVVYSSNDGTYHYVNGAYGTGMVYESCDDRYNKDVLVFSGD